MFNVDDLVTYGSFGVCRIKRIGTKPNVDHSRIYYELLPIDGDDHMMISIPSDNDTLVARMQEVMTKTEFEHVLLQIKQLSVQWVSDANKRKQRYRDILEQGSALDLFKLVKEVKQHRHQSAQKNATISQHDKHCYDQAIKRLIQECACILDVSQDMAKELILSQE